MGGGGRVTSLFRQPEAAKRWVLACGCQLPAIGLQCRQSVLVSGFSRTQPGEPPQMFRRGVEVIVGGRKVSLLDRQSCPIVMKHCQGFGPMDRRGLLLQELVVLTGGVGISRVGFGQSVGPLQQDGVVGRRFGDG